MSVEQYRRHQRNKTLSNIATIGSVGLAAYGGIKNNPKIYTPALAASFLSGFMARRNKDQATRQVQEIARRQLSQVPAEEADSMAHILANRPIVLMKTAGILDAFTYPKRVAQNYLKSKQNISDALRSVDWLNKILPKTNVDRSIGRDLSGLVTTTEEIKGLANSVDRGLKFTGAGLLSAFAGNTMARLIDKIQGPDIA